MKKSFRRKEGEGPKPWGVWLRAEESRGKQGGAVGGAHFQGDGSNFDGASWRKASSQKESPGDQGNPSAANRYGYGDFSGVGNSFHNGRRSPTNINEETESSAKQLDKMTCEMGGASAESRPFLTKGKITKDCVAPPEEASCDNMHAHGQQAFTQGLVENICTPVEEKTKGSGHQVVQMEEPVGESNAAAHVPVRSLRENATITAMVTEEGRVTNECGEGKSVRKWKRQARGGEHKSGEVQKLEKAEKKRKNSEGHG